MAAVASARSGWTERLKDAVLAAAVAAALAIPLIGFHAADQPTGIRIETRFDWVVIGVGAVFLGRLLLVGAKDFWPAHISERLVCAGAALRPFGKAIVWLGLVFAVALP